MNDGIKYRSIVGCETMEFFQFVMDSDMNILYKVFHPYTYVLYFSKLIRNHVNVQ